MAATRRTPPRCWRRPRTASGPPLPAISRAATSCPGLAILSIPTAIRARRCLLALLGGASALTAPQVRLANDVCAAVYAILGLRPTIDFALAALALTLGTPRHSPLAIFALGRTAGWIGHAIEQYALDQLIRPRARYTGPGAARPIKNPSFSKKLGFWPAAPSSHAVQYTHARASSANARSSVDIRLEEVIRRAQDIPSATAGRLKTAPHLRPRLFLAAAGQEVILVKPADHAHLVANACLRLRQVHVAAHALAA